MCVLRLLLAATTGYLLGTAPSADVAARLAGRRDVDLRASGSRNPGGVNAIRLLGNTPGRAVIVADVAKGYAACACGRLVGGELGAHVAGVAAVAGHCYPVWTRFQGGKGVATSFGQCLYTFPVFAPAQLTVAVAATRAPRVRQRALAAAGAASAAWLAASVVWWKRDLPNSWGPQPTVALPIATAATVLVVASAFARALHRRDPDDLASH
ncbi:MAG: glycerol-3-phosphate acyltransferase [Actinomycetota bacterium]|nr:glycerol-3-phosphate acyltransferase [Actinomycetota bacterium]